MPLRPLSPREQDILDAAASGLTYREMARRFYLAESTVKNTATLMLRDMDARTIAHAVAKWLLVRDDYTRARDDSPPDLAAVVGDVPPPPQRAGTLDDYIAARLAQEGACVVWTGPMDGGLPVGHTTRQHAGHAGSAHLSVRRYLYEVRYGPLPRDLYVHGACPAGRLHCVSHVAVGPAGARHWRTSAATERRL